MDLWLELDMNVETSKQGMKTKDPNDELLLRIEGLETEIGQLKRQVLHWQDEAIAYQGLLNLVLEGNFPIERAKKLLEQHARNKRELPCLETATR